MRRYVEREGLASSIEVDSAGTYGGHAGDMPDARILRAAAARGYVLTHRARRLTEEDFRRFDRIVVMDDMNYEAAYRMAPSREAGDRICRMRDYLSSFGDWSYIPDPYYEGARGFELVLDMLEEGCRALLEQIRGALGLPPQSGRR